MVTTILVGFNQEAGWLLLDLLDADSFAFQIEAAFWKYDEDAEAWRLYIASPRVGTDGPLALYQRIQTLLGNVPEETWGDFDLQDIVLVRPDANVVREMRQRYGPLHASRGFAVRRRDIAQDEPFIYRL